MKDLIQQIKSKNPQRILLQLPEGLKTKSTEIAEEIEREGIAVFLSGDACYGACDLRDIEAENLGCNLVVHVGHDKFYKDLEPRVPVLYYPWEIDVDLDGIDFSVIKENRIGLLTTIQHSGMLENVANKLKEQNKEPITGGLILGCWTTNAEKIKDKVNAFLFVGSGQFHALALTGKIYRLDLETKRIEDISNELNLWEKKRQARISKASDARIFAILVSSKAGQFNLEKAEKIKKLLKEKDKKAFIIIMDEITDEKLLGINVDAFINTACPRIADNKFSKPVINSEDAEGIE